MADDTDNPVDQLVENLLYAPVGLALEARENWATYIERGRSQVTISRFLARSATKKSASTAEQLADRFVNEVGQVIVDVLGIDLSPDDAAFPIDDYEARTAADVVSLLPGLSETELALVRRRELDGKARVTVLRKIDQRLGEA